MTRRKINLDVIDEDSASEAIDIIATIARKNRIEWALVGGFGDEFVWKRQTDKRY